MAHCSRCSAEIPKDGRFCSSCGAAVDTPTSAPTQTSLESERPTTVSPPAGGAGSDAVTSHPSLDRSRFVPGSLLDKRYRIVGLLGRGGMGEVYRADDLKLGRPVALKFLPREFERHERRLNRFLQEARTALQVTHSNVCRVYDIGEIQAGPGKGQHYLSMEYVDGEDLSSLLRRIGRLPQDKALQIARQLCAGVRAAHEQGILHRDLKPANVMIDGRGHVKITDFGLAGLEETIEEGEIRSGTPAYMAPEQLAGKEVTVRSDIYALGLVLYELFTGKRAFEASSLTEIVRLQSDSTPSNPSSHVEGFDPAVEKAILRCLEKRPEDRPSSALAVAAALPGGGPLAAALAAGETPSPEMVADAGSAGGLRPPVALTLLFVTLAGLFAVAWTWDSVLVGRIDTEKSPELLAADAREVIRLAGYDAEPFDTVIGYASETTGFRPPPSDGPPSPPPLRFWWRQSPSPIVPVPNIGNGPVRWSDPPLGDPGEIRVRLDLDGRLIVFQAVPPSWAENDEKPAREPGWSSLFASAGLAIEAFRPVPPRWNPPLSAEHRLAWEGSRPDAPDAPIRVEAGSHRGRPVYFNVVPSQKDSDPEVPTVLRLMTLAGGLFVLTMLVGGGLLARRNLRLGRADRRGAFRFGVGYLVLQLVAWALVANHVPDGSELMLLILASAIALWTSVVIAGIVWIATEPHLRRLWPEVLISWTRLVDGRLRDPMVGRDLLVGAFLGITLCFLSLHLLPVPMATSAVSRLIGVRFALGWVLHDVHTSVFFSLVFTTLLLILRILLRRRWLAGLAWVALVAFPAVGFEPAAAVFFIAMHVCLLLVLVRFGLLALCTAMVFLNTSMLTLDVSEWFFPQSVVVMSILAAVAVYGFRTALGGRPVFSDKFLDVREPSAT